MTIKRKVVIDFCGIYFFGQSKKNYSGYITCRPTLKKGEMLISVVHEGWRF